MDEIANQTFDEIVLGAMAGLTRTLIWDDVRLIGVTIPSTVGMLNPRI